MNTFFKKSIIGFVLLVSAFVTHSSFAQTEQEVVVTFPGWLEVEYAEFASNPGHYHPKVKTNGSLTRNPGSAPLYLTLENRTTNQNVVLHTFSQDYSQSFHFTWPESQMQINALIPGNEYAIFLSDLPSGANAVLYEGESTYMPFSGAVPGGGGTLEEETPTEEEDDEDPSQGGGGTGGGGTQQNPGGGGQTNPLNNTQEDIIARGIVTDDCGYRLGRTLREGEERGRICGFNDLMILVNRVIEYIFILILPLLAIVFAYAGYIYLTSGGNSGKRTKAKDAMTNALIGILVIMMAWLAVRTIVGSLGVNTSIIRDFLG